MGPPQTRNHSLGIDTKPPDGGDQLDPWDSLSVLVTLISRSDSIFAGVQEMPTVPKGYVSPLNEFCHRVTFSH